MGKTVLFTGTPCQVYAVRHYCEHNNVDTSKLYLVDIICHGTGIAEVWEKYKEWLEEKYKNKIVKFDFRYKKAKWKSYPVRVLFEYGKELVNTHDARLYTNLFLSKLIMRECCYQCKFANLDRPSDLTIGDFWGISRVMPDFPKGNGTSEILVNTEKGEEILCGIAKLPHITIKECLSDAYIQYQHNLTSPTEKNPRREEFKADLERLPFDDVLRIYAGNNLKGKTIYLVRRTLGEIGLTDLLKKALKR